MLIHLLGHPAAHPGCVHRINGRVEDRAVDMPDDYRQESQPRLVVVDDVFVRWSTRILLLLALPQPGPVRTSRTPSRIKANAASRFVSCQGLDAFGNPHQPRSFSPMSKEPRIGHRGSSRSRSSAYDVIHRRQGIHTIHDNQGRSLLANIGAVHRDLERGFA